MSEPDEPVPVLVECYAGYRGEETPRRFVLDRRRFDVEQVLERWRSPNHRYFKVRARDPGGGGPGPDGRTRDDVGWGAAVDIEEVGIFVVRQNHSEERWEITGYEPPPQR